MDIVEEIRQNPESGARRLAAEYKAGLMTLARRFCNDPGDAEELVNATFATVVENIESHLEQASFFSWMCQILTSLHSRNVRRLSNQDIVYPGILPDAIDERAQEEIYDNLDHSLVREALGKLEPGEKEVLVLHYFLDIPIAKMAKVLAIPAGTVKSRLHYARKALAAKLGIKANEAVKKPAVKATLLALALCATAALGAVWWGELSERAAAGGSRFRAASSGGTGETSETGGFSPVAPTPTPVPPDSPVPPVPDVPFVSGVPSTTLSKETTMNTTTLRTLAASAAFAAASAATLAPAPIMAGSVYDDAKVWFRGGYDANEDGAFTASEFVDSARPKSDTTHQTVTITGKGAAYSLGPVWSAFNPFYTNTQYYVSLTNGDCAAASDCSSIRIVNPLEDGETWSRFTIFIRFRWDGKFAPESTDKFYIVDTGQNWGGQRCFKFGFKYFPATDDFAPCWEIGASSNGKNPTSTAGIKLPAGEWRDYMITVVDPGVGGNAYIEVVTGKNGKASYVASQSVYLQNWVQNAQTVYRVGLQSTDRITVGTSTFSGDIAAFAIWPRKLASGDNTYGEMREAMADPRPGDAVFRIGKEDGKADEFASSGSAQYAIDANGTWDVVPPSLDTAHKTLTVNFDVAAGWANLNQILRLVAVSGDGWIEGSVADAVRGTSANLKARILKPGHPADFFVPGDALQSGPHTLTLRLANGSGVAFDVIELRGSFRLGVIDYSLYPNAQFDATSGQTYYNVVDGYWRAMNGNLADDTLCDPSAANYDPSNVDATTVFFNVPEDLVCCSNSVTVSFNQFQSQPSHIRWYLNNVQIHDSANPYQFTVGKDIIHANSLAAGQNTLKLRRSTSSSWWGSIRGLGFHVLNAPPPDPVATVICFK